MPPILRPSTIAKTEASKARLRYAFELMKDAVAGHQYAQFDLGMMYFHPDKGFPKSKRKALYWLSKSAAQGNEAAAHMLKMFEPEKPPTIVVAVPRRGWVEAKRAVKEALNRITSI